MIAETIANEFNQCNKCGLCVVACPVCQELFLEKYSPRGKIQLAKFYEQGALELSDHYRDIFSKCLLCGACSVTCPSGVDLSKVFLGMREEIADARGFQSTTKQLVKSLHEHFNISGEANADRGEWLDDLEDAPDDLIGKDRADVVYFVGCVASFFPMVQAIPRNVVRILSHAGVDFTILGGEEWCCGFPLMGAGASGEMTQLVEHNLERLNALKAHTVIFSCPSCYRTWKELYHTELEMFHSTQFIGKLIREGSLPLGKIETTVTYHDPCDLGRKGGVFDEPRELLRSIPGLVFRELENNRAKSVCCGGGGNLEMADPDLSARVARNKIEEIQRTGATTVVTSCQQCIRTIKSRARRQKVDLDVLDVTDLVVRAMEAGQ
ncbi:MAG: (Fe-S)-binding protein [Desulfobulbaceae bacterium]|nr:(Fe-S)-binding protein [Desulfobulbaceae bacterium]